MYNTQQNLDYEILENISHVKHAPLTLDCKIMEKYPMYNMQTSL